MSLGGRTVLIPRGGSRGDAWAHEVELRFMSDGAFEGGEAAHASLGRTEEHEEFEERRVAGGIHGRE